MLIRLQKYLADQGVCSRRRAEELITAGKIKINGQTAKLGDKIEPETDKISVNKRPLNPHNKSNVYLVLNKPTGYICSTTDQQGQTVLDLISKQDKQKIGRVYPAGRLDKDSHGLVLLTNDGELTNQLTHPGYEHEKEYEVEIDRRLNPIDRIKLEKGMKIAGVILRGITVKDIKKGKRNYTATVILREGKNRQIRKMFGQLGYNIRSLKRIRINKLKLGKLKKGEYKLVSKNEIV